MSSGIYTIKNTVTNKMYVGSAVDLSDRFSVHICALKYGRHHNDYLQKSWDKYGEDSFVFDVIEECPKEILIEREQYWIDLYNVTNRAVGYNILEHAGSRSGFKHKEETKKKISESLRGKMSDKNNPMYGRTGSKSPNFGKPMSEETKRKLSEAKTGRKLTEEHKKKISKAVSGKNNPMYGVYLKHSKETRKKMSDSRRGVNNPSYHSGKLVTYENKTMSICEWADYLGLTSSALYGRINRGWDLERAFKTPLRKY